MRGLQYYIAVFLLLAFICQIGALRCRTEDGPTTEEIKRVVRICMQRTNEHYPDGQQHHRDRDNKNKNDNYDEGDYKDDDNYDDSASDDSNSNESSASTSKRNSDQQDSHSHHNNQRRDSHANSQYPYDYYQQQQQKYDNYGGGDMNNRRDNRQQQQNSPTRHYDPYGGGQHEQQQQQRDIDGYAGGYNSGNNNYPNDNRYGGNEYSMRRVRDADTRRRSSVHASAQWQLHDNQTTGHRMFNMQDNKQTHHGMMGNSNGSAGNENQTQQHQGSCMVQCFFQELKMTNRDGLPDKHKMLTVMTKDVRDAQLKDFYVDSIQECHRILEMDYVHEKCLFARNLVSCLSERARANCEDFRESMLF